MNQSSQCEFQREFKFGMKEKKVAVKIQKTIYGVRNTENLTKSTCFYLKSSQVHVFCSNFSQVCMFCDDNRLELVPGSTRSGFFPS